MRTGLSQHTSLRQELRVNPMGTWLGDIPYADVKQAWA